MDHIKGMYTMYPKNSVPKIIKIGQCFTALSKNNTDTFFGTQCTWQTKISIWKQCTERSLSINNFTILSFIRPHLYKWNTLVQDYYSYYNNATSILQSAKTWGCKTPNYGKFRGMVLLLKTEFTQVCTDKRFDNLYSHQNSVEQDRDRHRDLPQMSRQSFETWWEVECPHPAPMAHPTSQSEFHNAWWTTGKGRHCVPLSVTCSETDTNKVVH